LKYDIVAYEQRINDEKIKFLGASATMLELVGKDTPPSEISIHLATTLHPAALAFFNLFERSIREYGLKGFNVNEDFRNGKVDDSVVILGRILSYWATVRMIGTKYRIEPPVPTPKAYGTIQGLVNTFNSGEAARLKVQFAQANLPWNDNPLVNNMVSKKQITFSIGAGLVFMVALLIITLVVDCPTQSQSTMFSIILAVACAAFAASIPGFINFRYKEIITAGGALAVFAIIFALKPATIEDFKKCGGDEFFRGTVLFGESPSPGTTVRLLQLDQSTITNESGNFTFQSTVNALDDQFRISLKNKEIELDTVVMINKIELGKSVIITLPKFCIECLHKDNTGKVIRSSDRCFASKRILPKYKAGFEQAGTEQKLITECK
jgi:hypothetical protein